MSELVERFYVYTLINSLTEDVFYVGKGRGHRINAHERDARNGIDNKKCRVIRQIWADGGEIIKTKVQENMAEADAYTLEIELISKYGLANLTNFAEGGEGRPQLRTEPMNDYHILLPLDLADKLDAASKNGGVIAYVERVLRDHFEAVENRPEEIAYRCRQTNIRGREDMFSTNPVIELLQILGTISPLILFILLIVILLIKTLDRGDSPDASLRRTKPRQRYDYDRVTKTGETFGERKSYHDRGELSPGEHALAKAIRESLRARDE